MKTLLKPFRAAIFDLDGTLLDSLGVWAEIDCLFLKKRGIPVPPDYQHAVKVMNFTEAAEYTAMRFSLNESPADLVAEWMEMIRSAYAHDVALTPFAAEYLSKLRAEGVKIAAATSGDPTLFLPALSRNGVKELFSAFVTTAEVGKGKRHPDVYLEAARRLQTPPSECAVFEDVLAAIKTARAAGFYTVAVREESSLHEEAELRAESDAFIVSYRELL